MSDVQCVTEFIDSFAVCATEVSQLVGGGQRPARLARSLDKIGEAVSIVLNGIMVGTVVGLAVSHFIADRWNWQATFYVLGAAAVVVFVVSLLALPPREAATADDAAQDMRNLRLPRLWSRYLVSFLTIGAAYAAFSYLTPLLEQSAGFSLAGHRLFDATPT